MTMIIVITVENNATHLRITSEIISSFFALFLIKYVRRRIAVKKIITNKEIHIRNSLNDLFISISLYSKITVSILAIFKPLPLNLVEWGRNEPSDHGLSRMFAQLGRGTQLLSLHYHSKAFLFTSSNWC